MVFGRIKTWLVVVPNYKVPPWGLHWRSHTLFITGTIGIGLFTDLFLYGLIVPVLPYLLHDRIEIPIDEVQRHVSGLLAAYAGSCVVFSPFAGYIADKTSSRQQPYIWSLLALFVATFILYIAETEAVLYLARVLQGLAAVIVWTVGLALCLETVGPKNLGTAIGTIFSFMGFAALVAPVVGGILYEKTGSIGVFAISIAVITLDFIMRLLVIEKKIAHRYDPTIIDPLLDDSFQEQQSSDNEAEPLLARNGHDDKIKFLIPSDLPTIVQKIPILYCFKSSRLATSMLVSFVQALLLGSFDATVPTEAQSLFGFSSLEAGLLFIPIGICDLVIGPVAGWLVDKYGVKPMSTLGFACLAPILVSLRTINTGTQDQLILYCCLLGLCGVGLAAIGAPSVVEAGDVINKYHKANPEVFGETGPYAQLYGFNSMIYAAGLAIGPFLAGGLREGIGYGNMNAVLGGICAFTALTSYVYIGGKPRWIQKSLDKVVVLEDED